MKKTLGVIILFMLAVATSVIISLYIIDQQFSHGGRGNLQIGRYELTFGQITHSTSEPSGEPGIINVENAVRPICFKFDSATGETWRYVSDFYKDPNKVMTTRGFERVFDNEFPYSISDVSERKKLGTFSY